MVKGISRQVIVVQSPDQKMFEQAIFIIREGAPEVTDDHLLKEANRLINSSSGSKRMKLSAYGAFWACAGAFIMGMVWILSGLF